MHNNEVALCHQIECLCVLSISCDTMCYSADLILHTLEDLLHALQSQHDYRKKASIKLIGQTSHSTSHIIMPYKGCMSFGLLVLKAFCSILHL